LVAEPEVERIEDQQRWWGQIKLTNCGSRNVEMPDKLRIVILPSARMRAYTFGAVRNSFGIIPKPGGATG
jgi:hypothetical protein